MDIETTIVRNLGVMIASVPALNKADSLSAAEAIMTTDILPKAVSRRVRLSKGEATVTGIAKGAGMIRQTGIV